MYAPLDYNAGRISLEALQGIGALRSTIKTSYDGDAAARVERAYLADLQYSGCQ
jgi:hypothetical protein